jgi:hypothetical protein
MGKQFDATQEEIDRAYRDGVDAFNSPMKYPVCPSCYATSKVLARAWKRGWSKAERDFYVDFVWRVARLP